MGKIAHVELKLYAKSEDKDALMEELERIFRESPSLMLSSIKSIEIISEIDINFAENKKMEKSSTTFYNDLLLKGKGKYLEMLKNLENMKEDLKQPKQIDYVVFCPLCLRYLDMKGDKANLTGKFYAIRKCKECAKKTFTREDLESRENQMLKFFKVSAIGEETLRNKHEELINIQRSESNE